MKMTELEFAGQRPPIDGYAPSGFRIAGRFFDGAMLLGPKGPVSWDAPSLTQAAAVPLKALRGEIDLLLIGLGAELVEVPAEFRGALAPLEADAAGFGVDYMATPAACRTYNILLAEERRVAAALLTV